MLERMFGAGVFGLAAFLFGFAISFSVLKLFKVKDPIENRFFFAILGCGMILAYMLRAYLKTA